MRPALYVDIDVDLYTSTYSCLDWLLGERLMPAGATVYYDDWGAGGEGGNKLAHKRCFGKYNVSTDEAPKTRTRASVGTRVFDVM